MNQIKTLDISLKKRRYILILTFFLLSSVYIAFGNSDDLPVSSSPPRLVNDFASVFTSSQQQQLENMLNDYSDTTSTQITVVTITSLNGYDIADYTDRLAEKWGVGKKEKNNGIMILIKPKLSNNDYGEVRISVGYGLEEFVPDAITHRIIQQEMIPLFRSNNYYQGTMAAIKVIFDLASGKYSADEYDNNGINPWGLVIFFLIFLIVLLCIIFGSKHQNIDHNGSKNGFHNTLPWLLFGSSLGRGWNGGHGSGGGSFGGFGGGSFGGGGASGRW